jgi:SAM-dependent methyltransferase
VSSGDLSKEFRPDVPSPARMYDYYLGGKDHYPADREAAERVMAAMPTGAMQTAARQNRGFLIRAVRHLAREAGIRQFLDIGCGLPTMNSVHEVVKAIDPNTRIVYVDNDPVVIAHGREMLQGVGQAVIIQHDLRDPEALLADERLRQTIDFDEPVAVLLVAILHFITNDQDARGIIQRLLAPFPSGSHLVISHGSADSHERLHDVESTYRRKAIDAQSRSREEITALLTGLDLTEPGLVWLPKWRPDPDTGLQNDPARSLCYAAVVRKP